MAEGVQMQARAAVLPSEILLHTVVELAGPGLSEEMVPLAEAATVSKVFPEVEPSMEIRAIQEVMVLAVQTVTLAVEEEREVQAHLELDLVGPGAEETVVLDLW